MRTRASIAFGIACLLAGCALHPLPENVTRETTFHIVQKIRCEAREAVNDISGVILKNSTNPKVQELGDLVLSRKMPVTAIFEGGSKYLERMDPKTHAYFSTFALTTVAFDFTFDMKETNDAQADSNFRDPVSRGIFSLGAKASSKYERQNERKFLTGDTFLELYDLLKEEECDKIVAGHKNYIYPITGNIGLREVFETFINLNSRSIDPTSPRPAKPSERANAVAAFIDTLSFTTTFNTTVTPKIELTPVSAHRFNLLNAQLAMMAERKDLHKVVITVVPGEPVTSLADARKKANIHSQKQKAFELLFLNRTEGLIRGLINNSRRFDELTR